LDQNGNICVADETHQFDRSTIQIIWCWVVVRYRVGFSVVEHGGTQTQQEQHIYKFFLYFQREEGTKGINKQRPRAIAKKENNVRWYCNIEGRKEGLQLRSRRNGRRSARRACFHIVLQLLATSTKNEESNK